VRAENPGEDSVTPTAVSDQVRAFVLEKFPQAKKKSLSDSDKLLESGIVDSLGILDLVAFLESDFKLQITDDELLPENFQTVEAIAEFVERKRNGGA
jgi:acyl carrier protein